MSEETSFDLNVAQTATIAGCHRNTVLHYERRGMIQCFRDVNGFRRIPLREALKLKAILEARLPKSHPAEADSGETA